MKLLQEIQDILITKNIDISMKCAFVHRTQSEWRNSLPLCFGLISQR